MFIQSDLALDSRYQNVDPIIVVEGGGINYSQLGTTNNMINFSFDNLYQMHSYHQFLAESTINIHCIASASDAAEELGFEVAMVVQSMKLISGEMLQFQSMSMPQQSKAQMMGRNEWAGKFDSVVSFQYSFAIKRKHTPVDPGELLKEIEFYFNHPTDTPMPGDKDQEGNPINTGDTGGTNTGGNNGNWGGDGGTGHSEDGEQDFVDDGWVEIKMKITQDTITGEQNQV